MFPASLRRFAEGIQTTHCQIRIVWDKFPSITDTALSEAETLGNRCDELVQELKSARSNLSREHVPKKMQSQIRLPECTLRKPRRSKLSVVAC